jgi:hypothetical protein
MFAENWLRSLIWTDYRLAVIFTVILPLILLLWALVQKAEAIQRLLTIYWCFLCSLPMMKTIT